MKNSSRKLKEQDRRGELIRQLRLEQELFRRKAKKNLLQFTLYTKDDYKANWHHKSYANVLDKFIEGKIKRLMVFMPPQHGKSELCSRRMPAKMLGMNPDKRICVVAYNHTFAAKFNRDIQRIIDNPKYRELFPETKLNSRNVRSNSGSYLRNSDEFEPVGKQGSLISVGVGGGLTGNKIDCAIIDDPYKDAQQANSPAYRRHLNDWWDSVLETRLHNDSQICLTFTRWRYDDIAGKLLDDEKNGKSLHKWHIVKYEALKEHKNKDPFDKRKPDQALWPQRHSVKRLQSIREINPTMFQALYQQDPTPKGGNVILDVNFGRYVLHELPEGVNHCYIDTASSGAELKSNDPSGILVARKHQNKLYLVYYTEGRWKSPELKRKILWVYEKFLQGSRSKVYIENKANARATKDDLEEKSSLNIILENIKGTKLERVENIQSILEAKRVLIPENDSWVDVFLTKCMGFPLMKHDEPVDCLTGAIRTILKHKSGFAQFGKVKQN